MRLGFIGLGIMGTPMALNLVRGGHDLVVWNRTGEACAPLAEAGATVAATAAEVARLADITFAMVSDPEAALSVATGPNGICAGLGDGRGYVDMSTVDAATSRTVAEAVLQAGGRFLEAPVSGTRGPAEQGTLIILAAGDETLYKEAEQAFGLMGKTVVHLGEVGNGARMKLVVNKVMGSMMAAFCEGLDLARSAGLDPADLLAVLDDGALANPMFRIKGPNMLAGDFTVAFPLKHMQKDLRLALAAGQDAEVPLPVATAANEAFVRALARGDGDLDFSAVWRTYEDE